MIDLLVYNNSSPTVVRGNSYIVDGSTLTFALPSIPLDYSNNYLFITVGGQPTTNFVYPSAQSIGPYGLDFLFYPTAEVDIRVLDQQDFVSPQLVTLQEVKDYLTINSNTFDAKLSNLIVYASDLVEDYCGRSFAAVDAIEYKDGGYPYVFVNNPPINNVYSVYEYDGIQYNQLIDPPIGGGLPNVAANANSIPGYTTDMYSGKIWKGFRSRINSSILNMQAFYPFSQSVQVSYNGGYQTIPGDLALCVLDIVKALHKSIDAQVTRFDRELIQQPVFSGGFPPHIRRVLDLYRLIQ